MSKRSLPLFLDNRIYLTFDDVLLVENLSVVSSRSEVNTTSVLPLGYQLEVPVMTAAMDTITSLKMAREIISAGGAVVHHRNQSVNDQIELLRPLKDHPMVVEKRALNGAAVGMQTSPEDIYRLIDAGANLIALEVAHAFSETLIDVLARIGPVCEYALLMVGNFSGAHAIKWLCSHEESKYVNLVKVSQGGGSACTTRIVTGIGKPTLQSVMDLSALDCPFSIVADGGIKSSGDAAKALAAGASAVMLGNMLSGTDECPGEKVTIDGQEYKRFYGMASKDAKEHAHNIEGVSTLVPAKGPVRQVLRQIKEGLQSSIASCGYTNLNDFQEGVQMIRVSEASRRESQPHIFDRGRRDR